MRGITQKVTIVTETSSDGSIGEQIMGFHGVPPLSAPGGVEDTLQGRGEIL